jgi:hypothetical protein
MRYESHLTALTASRWLSSLSLSRHRRRDWTWLHYDHHFGRLGDLLGVRMVWIADLSA